MSNPPAGPPAELSLPRPHRFPRLKPPSRMAQNFLEKNLGHDSRCHTPSPMISLEQHEKHENFRPENRSTVTARVTPGPFVQPRAWHYFPVFHPSYFILHPSLSGHLFGAGGGTHNRHRFARFSVFRLFRG